MTAGSFEGQYVWHPAADDHSLARACVDVRAGRYFSAYQVLEESRGDWQLRAHRSLVLASEAADSDLAERWLAEDPNAEAALLWARVAVIRALRVADALDSRTVPMVRMALGACERASQMMPQDPTPWTAKLALARLLDLCDPAPPGLLTSPPGPWALFSQVIRLDPWHREAHHRFLAFYFARHGGTRNAAWDVAAFLSQRAPISSELRLLPLVALVDSHDASVPLAERIWERPQWRATALGVYDHWFAERTGRRFTPVVDLSYLAHALLMAGRELEARAVLMAMEPYASRMPWSAFGDPEKELSRARCLCGLPAPAAK